MMGIDLSLRANAQKGLAVVTYLLIPLTLESYSGVCGRLLNIVDVTNPGLSRLNPVPSCQFWLRIREVCKTTSDTLK